MKYQLDLKYHPALWEFYIANHCQLARFAKPACIFANKVCIASFGSYHDQKVVIHRMANQCLHDLFESLLVLTKPERNIFEKNP